MTRAERRRLKKAEEKRKNPARYNVTEQQITSMVEREMGSTLQEMRQEAYDQAVNDAMILLLTIPLEVLMDHYWKKSYEQRLPKFTNYILEYYRKWQDGELDMDELREDLWTYGGIKFEGTGAGG